MNANEKGAFLIGSIMGFAVGALMMAGICMIEPEKTALLPQGPPTPVYVETKIPMVVTAYCYSERRPHDCDRHFIKKWNDGRTATGRRVSRGICAGDWRAWPPGTIFSVPGYGRCEVADRGGRIKGNRLDLFMESPVEARLWGKRRVHVTLIRYGKENV